MLQLVQNLLACVKICRTSGILSIDLLVSHSLAQTSGASASRTHKCRCETLFVVHCPFCSVLFLVNLATEIWKSVGVSGNRSAEKARSLPLIATCHDSGCLVEQTHIVSVLKSDAFLVVDQSGAKFDTSHVTGHEMRRAVPKHLARLGCLGGIFLAYVEDAMGEFDGLLGLEPTWAVMKDQLLVVVDALSVSLPPTSSAQVTAHSENGCCPRRPANPAAQAVATAVLQWTALCPSTVRRWYVCSGLRIPCGVKHGQEQCRRQISKDSRT